MKTTNEFYLQASALDRRILRADREKRRFRKEHSIPGSFRVPKIVRREVCWLHRNGKTDAQIARMRLISEMTIRRILRENNISRKSGRPLSANERWRRDALKHATTDYGLRRTVTERQNRLRLKPTQKQAIRMDLQRGHTRTAIAAAYGVSYSTVARLDGYGPPSPPKRIRRYGKLILQPGQRPRWSKTAGAAA